MITTIALLCSMWQGIQTCQDNHGYVSHEWQRQGETYGDDNAGNSWSTRRRQGQTIIEERQK